VASVGATDKGAFISLIWRHLNWPHFIWTEWQWIPREATYFAMSATNQNKVGRTASSENRVTAQHTHCHSFQMNWDQLGWGGMRIRNSP